MAGPFVIFDVDNCISDDAWRIPRINWKVLPGHERWHAYHLASAFDRAAHTGIMQENASEHIILFTAMPEEYRGLRELWLNHNRIGYNTMFMRPNDHKGHSEELKREMLYQFYELFGVDSTNVKMAYDDRREVIDMYHEENLQASTLRIHSVNAYSPPSLTTRKESK